eukprot:scaffold86248_cov57-Phaeocystis_antarctica.AAC.3
MAKGDAGRAADEQHVVAIEHEVEHVRARTHARRTQCAGEAPLASRGRVAHRVPGRQLARPRARQRHELRVAALALGHHHTAHARRATVSRAQQVARTHRVHPQRHLPLRLCRAQCVASISLHHFAHE